METSYAYFNHNKPSGTLKQPTCFHFRILPASSPYSLAQFFSANHWYLDCFERTDLSFLNNCAKGYCFFVIVRLEIIVRFVLKEAFSEFNGPYFGFLGTATFFRKKKIFDSFVFIISAMAGILLEISRIQLFFSIQFLS